MSSSIRSSLLALAAIAVLLSGCGFNAEKIPGIYRIDIQQGNVVTQNMLDQLKPGMDKRKVRYILGTPLITDTFNGNRWEYLYSFQKGGGEREQRRISVYFEKGKLVRLGGDVQRALTSLKPTERPEQVVVVPPSTKSHSLLDALTPSFLKRKAGLASTYTGTSTPEALATPAEATGPAKSAKPAKQPAAETASATTTPATTPGAGTASPASKPAPTEVATAPPPSATTEEDSKFLKGLFKDFGRSEAGGGSGGATPPGAEKSGAQPAGSKPAEKTAAEQSTTEDQGFLKRLMQRFKSLVPASSATTPATTESAPAAKPPVVAPVPTPH